MEFIFFGRAFSVDRPAHGLGWSIGLAGLAWLAVLAGVSASLAGGAASWLVLRLLGRAGWGWLDLAGLAGLVGVVLGRPMVCPKWCLISKRAGGPNNRYFSERNGGLH